MKAVVIAAGVAWALLFIGVGLVYELQLYADGSIFSYSVAVQDAWAIHWHNISGRMFVYLSCFVPAEAVVALTGHAQAGIVAYGFLFFSAQALGLAATFAVDRSRGRIIFCYACFSTACVCPLVFGFPTEMWMAHALFWPTLALCHYARRDRVSCVVIFALLLALTFSHEGGLVLAGVILLTLAGRGVRDAAFLRAAGAFGVALFIWLVVKIEWPPDAYIADVLDSAALHFFDPEILTSRLVLLLAGTLGGYVIILLGLRWPLPRTAELWAGAIVAVSLGIYWLWFDHSLHSENRYYLRTVLLIATGGLGMLAMAVVFNDKDRLGARLQKAFRLMTSMAMANNARAIVGAVALIALIHAVETAKFAAAWTDYKTAVRALATGATSDPALGDRRFVSSARIDADLNRLAWSSTTPYLSILLAPGFAPARLVVDPTANYFWMSCEAAKANEAADRVVPAESRGLIRKLECLHRQ